VTEIRAADTIPGASNLPYLDVIDQDNNKFKSPDAIKNYFERQD